MNDPPPSRSDQVNLQLGLAALLEDQRQGWRSGQPRTVEQLLEANPALANETEALLDLIYNELMLREERGEHPDLEEFQRRFPQIAAQLSMQFELERVLDLPLPPTSVDDGDSLPGEGPSPDPRGIWNLPGYEILAELGRGGSGVVYRARQVRLQRLVALKMILSGPCASRRELEAFHNEAQAVARLQHPNIVQVYDVGDHEGRPYMALELVDTSLARNLGGRPLPPRQAATWLETLARAVQYAHDRGVLHRDLKPANVLLRRDGVLKVTDFGLARILLEHPRNQTLTDAIVGTPAYMAPEQAEVRSEAMGPWTDVYGLGAILYEFLSGRPPFQARTALETLDLVRTQEPLPPSRLVRDIPRDLETICLRCLEKQPARRYPSAAALAEDLSAHLAGEPIRARRASLLERVVRWGRKKPANLLLGLAVVGAALILGIGFVGSRTLTLPAGIALVALAASAWNARRLRRALREVRLAQVRAERVAERFDLLLEMTRQLMRTKNLEEILRLLAETSVWLLNAELATIYLVDRERNELWSKVTVDSGVGEIRLPLGVGIAGTVAASGEAINIPDAYADPRFNQEVDRRTGHRTKNLLTAPMRGAEGETLGVFQVINKQDGVFEEDDVETLTALAASAAVALEQAMRGQGMALPAGHSS